MRNLKHVLAVVFIVVIAILPTTLFKYDMGTNILISLGLLMLAYQVISFSFRSNLSWKDFYTSRFNLLTAKTSQKLDFEFDQETLFEKAKEVLRTNGYKDLVIDESKMLILAKEPFSFKSWGENIYITILAKDNENAELLYESVAFQVYTWGKNEDNGKKFLANMEESFTI